jgi:RimJ/RimL family protein N-acetyltransferase
VTRQGHRKTEEMVMFVRTQRLTLRPGWIEDAPQLARAISHWDVCSTLATAPWPYFNTHAEDFLMAQRDAALPSLLIHEHVGGTVRLIGGIGIGAQAQGDPELGYWLTPESWGRGYATEAGLGVIRAARESLRLPRLVASHFTDNPASGKVLRKLGFRPTGRIEMRESRARGHVSPCATYELDLCADGIGDDPDARMAA